MALPAATIARVLKAVEALAEDPLPSGVVKLAGSEQTYRIRIGDYRLVYSVEHGLLVIEILRVAHRKDVYR